MSDVIQVRVGAAPWLPANSVEAVAEYQYYEFPLSGVVRQVGVEYLFMCVAGHDAPLNFWLYWRIPSDARHHLESSSTSAEFRQRLRDLPMAGMAVLAVASDSDGILGWQDFNQDVDGALTSAADDLMRWMDRVAVNAPMAHERSRELECV